MPKIRRKPADQSARFFLDGEKDRVMQQLGTGKTLKRIGQDMGCTKDMIYDWAILRGISGKTCLIRSGKANKPKK